MGKLEKLAALEPLSHLEEEQMGQLAACAWAHRFREGALVYRDGDPTRQPFGLVLGAVQLSRATPQGRFTVERIRRGELFGETSYIDHLARRGDAQVESEAEILIFDPDRLVSLAHRDPRFELGLRWALWRSLALKLRRANLALRAFFEEPAQVTGPQEEETRRPPAVEAKGDLSARRELFEEQPLSAMEVNFLASLSKEESFAAGETIFREGDPGEKMYVVREGKVRISKRIPGAGEEALAFLSRGDYFGEMALIDGEARSADATAHEGTTAVLSIPAEVLGGLLQMQHGSSSRLLGILCDLVARRLRQIDSKIIGWHQLTGWPAAS